MQSARTILFAADFSENSVEAFRIACSLAVERETRLIVLHVIDPDSDAAASSPGPKPCAEPGAAGARGLCPGSAPSGGLPPARGVGPGADPPHR